MRTMLLVLVMLLLSLIILAGLALPARAQTPPPALAVEVACDPTTVPADVDTLITCRFAAENHGPGALTAAQLLFLPSSAVSPPSRYFFFSYALDGVPRETGGGGLAYDFGDIPPGERRVIELGIIVRGRGRFGADVSVVAQPAQREYFRQTVIIAADAGVLPPIPMSLELVPVPLAPQLYQARLTMDVGDAEAVFITADIGLDQGFSIPDRFRRVLDGPHLVPLPAPGRFPLITVEVSPHALPGDREEFLFDIESSANCYGGTIAIVGHVRTLDGRVLRPALLDTLAPGACVSGLPGAGNGPHVANPGRGTASYAVAMLLAAIGAASAVVGAMPRPRG
jgi:hypothetical protein